MCVGWEGMMENVVESFVPIVMWRKVLLPTSFPTVFPASHFYSYHLPSMIAALPSCLFQTSLKIFPPPGIVSALHVPVSKSYTFYKVCLKSSLLHDPPHKFSKINQVRWNHSLLFIYLMLFSDDLFLS